MKPRKCYAEHCKKVGRRDSFFCTNRCAVDWADSLVDGMDYGWCGFCADWRMDPPGRNSVCGGCGSRLQRPKDLGSVQARRRCARRKVTS